MLLEAVAAENQVDVGWLEFLKLSLEFLSELLLSEVVDCWLLETQQVRLTLDLLQPMGEPESSHTLLDIPIFRVIFCSIQLCGLNLSVGGNTLLDEFTHRRKVMLT